MTGTIPELFHRQAAIFGARTLFLVKRDGAFQPISWQQAAEDVQALATWLLRQEIRVGDRVLILSENRPEWGVADLAIQSVGAWTVPIYPTLPPADIELISANCQPVLAFASSGAQLVKLLQVKTRVPSLRALVLMDGPAAPPVVVSWAETLARGRELTEASQAAIDERRRHRGPEETCTLIYTSGTTGEPKGVMLSHRNFLSNVASCLQVMPIAHSDLHLSFLPLCHVFERMAGWYLMLQAGASVAYAESMDTIPEDMRQVRPTIMLGVPRFFEKLHDRIREALRSAPPLRRRIALWALNVGQRTTACREAQRPLPVGLRVQQALARRLVFKTLQQRLGGRLRFCVSGSAPLSEEIARFFFSVGVTILEGYGLTETSPVITANRLPVPRFGSVGQAVPGVEVRIADDGEILTRGPHVMQGYFQHPEATREVLSDGWLHTGDIGRLDEEGYLYITDRKKDLIKTSGGKFVAPQKLENLFVADPEISQAFVYGDRERYCVALIVPNAEALRRWAHEQGIPGDSLAQLVREPRVQAFYWDRVQQRQQALPSFEQVKRIALLDQEFSQAQGELTPTLKAKRQLIATRYAPILRQLYEVPLERGPAAP